MKITVNERFLGEAIAKASSKQLEEWLKQAVEEVCGSKCRVEPVGAGRGLREVLEFDVSCPSSGLPADFERKLASAWIENRWLQYTPIGTSYEEGLPKGTERVWMFPAVAKNVQYAAENMTRSAADRVWRLDLLRHKRPVDEIEACFHKRLDDICQEMAEPSGDARYAARESAYGMTADDVYKVAPAVVEERLEDLTKRWQRKLNPSTAKGLDRELADKVVKHTIDYLDESEDLANYIFDRIDNVTQLEAKAGKLAADEVGETLSQVRTDWEIPRSVKAAQVKEICTPALWDKLLKQVVTVGKSYLDDK